MESVSQVKIVKQEVELCKESTEVFEAVEGVVVAIKSGKTVAEIVASELPRLMTAVNGFEQLPVEVKNEHFYETAGLGGARITKALIGK